jgi:hypothetical protein
MELNLKNCSELLGFGLCPSSGILKTREHNVSETGSASAPGAAETSTLLSPLERANLNHGNIQFLKHCVL